MNQCGRKLESLKLEESWKNQDFIYGVVEKWCSETNTFVFPFGEATITLEDVMVLGGYPIIGHPVFTKVKDQEMREVEEKLIIARQKPWQIQNGWICSLIKVVKLNMKHF